MARIERPWDIVWMVRFLYLVHCITSLGVLLIIIGPSKFETFTLKNYDREFLNRAYLNIRRRRPFDIVWMSRFIYCALCSFSFGIYAFFIQPWNFEDNVLFSWDKHHLTKKSLTYQEERAHLRVGYRGGIVVK